MFFPSSSVEVVVGTTFEFETQHRKFTKRAFTHFNRMRYKLGMWRH